METLTVKSELRIFKDIQGFSAERQKLSMPVFGSLECSNFCISAGIGRQKALKMPRETSSSVRVRVSSGAL